MFLPIPEAEPTELMAASQGWLTSHMIAPLVFFNRLSALRTKLGVYIFEDPIEIVFI
jgi:hypothetical protein